jgi:hypothetical protein
MRFQTLFFFAALASFLAVVQCAISLATCNRSECNSNKNQNAGPRKEDRRRPFQGFTNRKSRLTGHLSLKAIL